MNNQDEREQVMEVARMLYALEQFREILVEAGLVEPRREPIEFKPRQPLDLDDKSQWPHLVFRAFKFLDNLQKTYPNVKRFRDATDETLELVKAAIAEADAAKLAEFVPFPQAAKFITGETHITERAVPKLKPFLHSMPPDYFDCATERKKRALIKRWDNKGVPLDEVIGLRLAYDDGQRIAREKREAERAKQATRKKRTQWEGKRVNKTLLATQHREKRREKVDALLHTAKTGERHLQRFGHRPPA
jgi:hypothetical protein